MAEGALVSHGCSFGVPLSGPEPGEPHWSHSLHNVQPFRGPALGWLRDGEAPTPRPARSNAEAWPLVPGALPAPPGLSSSLCLPGTARRTPNRLSPSRCQPRTVTPTPLASLPKHKSGCGGGGGGLLELRWPQLSQGRHRSKSSQVIVRQSGPQCTHLPSGGAGQG